MIRADGRWGGRVTNRPLLHGDETLALLSDEDRAALSEVWLGRAATERRVADSFAVIRDALGELGSDSSLVALADRAVDDEWRHAEICRFVASRFVDRELDPPPALELLVPKHHGADRQLTLELWVVGQCCMNETIASAFLEAAVTTSNAPMARGALRELLSDEIDHARLGWAFLATLPRERLDAIGPWLFGMLRENLKLWRDAPRGYPMTDALAAQGAPREAVVEDSLLTSVRELVIPGLERFALPTDKIQAWLASGAPTESC
jgi:hypothetical protein